MSETTTTAPEWGAVQQGRCERAAEWAANELRRILASKGTETTETTDDDGDDGDALLVSVLTRHVSHVSSDDENDAGQELAIAYATGALAYPPENRAGARQMRRDARNVLRRLVRARANAHAAGDVRTTRSDRDRPLSDTEWAELGSTARSEWATRHTAGTITDPAHVEAVRAAHKLARFAPQETRIRHRDSGHGVSAWQLCASHSAERDALAHAERDAVRTALAVTRTATITDRVVLALFADDAVQTDPQSGRYAVRWDAVARTLNAEHADAVTFTARYARDAVRQWAARVRGTADVFTSARLYRHHAVTVPTRYDVLRVATGTDVLAAAWRTPDARTARGVLTVPTTYGPRRGWADDAGTGADVLRDVLTERGAALFHSVATPRGPLASGACSRVLYVPTEYVRTSYTRPTPSERAERALAGTLYDALRVLPAHAQPAYRVEWADDADAYGETRTRSVVRTAYRVHRVAEHATGTASTRQAAWAALAALFGPLDAESVALALTDHAPTVRGTSHAPAVARVTSARSERARAASRGWDR